MCVSKPEFSEASLYDRFTSHSLPLPWASGWINALVSGKLITLILFFHSLRPLPQKGEENKSEREKRKHGYQNADLCFQMEILILTFALITFSPDQLIIKENKKLDTSYE